MKFYFSVPSALRPYWRDELTAYESAINAGQLQAAWTHLERAHILGQSYPVAHSYVHWRMLLFGVKIKSVKEVVGQIPRLLLGGVKSFVGAIPVGNPGGSNVPPMKSFPIPLEIQDIFASAGVYRGIQK